MKLSRSALLISRSRSEEQQDLPSSLLLASKTSLGSLQSDNDLYDLPLEEIAAQFKANPFFRVKVNLLHKRRKYILDMVGRDRINLCEPNPKETVNEERVKIKTGKNAALRSELEQIAAILKAVGSQ